MAEGGGRFVIYAALGANLGIAVTKFAAAAITGSSAMLTEGVHSFVDTGNQALMLYGQRRSRRPADAIHPLGYGREIYFWTFVVAILIFAGGAIVSIWEGIAHVRAPEPISRPGINFAVLGAAFLLEGFSWVAAWREFSGSRGDESFWQSIRRSKDPTTLAVLLEDSAALIGIVLAAIFIGLALWTGDPRLDGVGSILIGGVLAVVAVLLARESKGLLIGERAAPALTKALTALAHATPGVCGVNEVIAVHLAPEEVIALLSLDFDDDLTAGRLEAIVASIEARAKAAHGELAQVFVRPQAGRGAPSGDLSASGGRG